MSAPSPPPATGPEAQLAGALLSVAQPPLKQLSDTLVELQEAQQVLVSTIAAKRAELLEASPEWREARALLERVPEYQAKLGRIAKTMAATQALTAKVERGSAGLRAKVEAEAAAKAERKNADAAGFAAVASR